MQKPTESRFNYSNFLGGNVPIVSPTGCYVLGLVGSDLGEVEHGGRASEPVDARPPVLDGGDAVQQVPRAAVHRPVPAGRRPTRLRVTGAEASHAAASIRLAQPKVTCTQKRHVQRATAN